MTNWHASNEFMEKLTHFKLSRKYDFFLPKNINRFLDVPKIIKYATLNLLKARLKVLSMKSLPSLIIIT